MSPPGCCILRILIWPHENLGQAGMAGGVIYSGVTPTKPPDDRPVTSKLQERRKESSFAHQRDFNAKVRCTLAECRDARG